MGFLDIFKKFFAKKEPPATSPSEPPIQKDPNLDGQFATPQNPDNIQQPNQPQNVPPTTGGTQ